ncbi:MAG TPA: universal stress protein [Gaiellales bacterium]|nr:universal stress protein [Gaiellales bacterium]
MLPGSELVRSDAVVVGYDGSPRSAAALSWAIGETHEHGGHTVAVVAWHHSSLVPGARGREEAEHAAEEIAAQAREQLADAGVEGEVRVIEGDAVMALLEASQLARMLVLGEPHHGLGRIGSVAKRCQADAACPVRLVGDES